MLKMWAVCLYVEGGAWDGEYVMEFVVAEDERGAEVLAKDTVRSRLGDVDDFQSCVAVEVPPAP